MRTAIEKINLLQGKDIQYLKKNFLNVRLYT